MEILKDRAISERVWCVRVRLYRLFISYGYRKLISFNLSKNTKNVCSLFIQQYMRQISCHLYLKKKKKEANFNVMKCNWIIFLIFYSYVIFYTIPKMFHYKGYFLKKTNVGVFRSHNKSMTIFFAL